MGFEFVPVDFDYFDFEGRNYVRLIGRNGKGEKVCVVDSYEPNFYVILRDGVSKKRVSEIVKDIEKVEVEKGSRTSRVVKTEVVQKKFLGEVVDAIRVFVTNHKDAHDVASAIGDYGEIVHRREYDIPLITKYIKEKNVEPLCWYTVEGRSLGLEDFGRIVDGIDAKEFYEASSFKKIEKEFVPRILAYDIETDDAELGKGEILMISVFGEKAEKVFTWKKCSGAQKYVECYSDEAEMIEAFADFVREYDADILTGYFSDGFDLPYLKARADVNKIKLDLGLDGKSPSFTRGRIPSGKICGTVHMDIFRFIDAVFSQYLQSETLSLNEVGKELVGDVKEDFDFSLLGNMKDSDWKDFFSYNLHDSRLTWKLAEKIWPDIYEFVRIIKEPLFDVTRDRMSSHVENYLIHNLDRFDEIIEKRPMHGEIGDRKAMGKYEGAFVFEPKPGLYEDIGVFDFTSMHASIIVSFNLSKSTFLPKKESGAYATPEFDFDGKKSVFYFSKEEGFFPKLLGEVVDLRKKYKKEYNRNKSNLLKARSNAYKLLANASYGYLGFFGARYYCREAAASTLAFVRDFTKESIEKIKRRGYEVIFSDTDSIGFELNGASRSATKEFLKKLNDELPGIMELDLEDFYSRGLFVSKRTVKTGAKKKYALIGVDGKMKIRGFETVRRDWCRLARKLQSEVLLRILEDGNETKALELLKKTIKRLKERKVEKKEILIRTQLKKAIGEYLSEGPHVAAAKKMEEKEIPVSQGMLIEYFVGETNFKAKRISDKVFLPDEEVPYDTIYYLENQVLPAVENIFDVFGVDVSEVVAGESQKKLF